MSYCQNCGTEIDNDARFCPNCGQSKKPSSSPARQPRANGAKRLHCPNCQSNSISPVVETEISGGMSMNHSFSRKNSVSAISLNNTHRNYWMCSDCGHKFRNLQNLEDELAALHKAVISAILGIILLVVLGMFSSSTLGFGITLAFLVPVIALVIVAIFVVKNKIEKMEAERVYLKKHCF